jgi:hypothetical protein
VTLLKQSLALLLVVSLLFATAPAGFAYPANEPGAPTPVRAAQQTPEQLQQRVAPIALYPDALVAQILAASTYPDQVVEADRWLQQHSDPKDKQLGDYFRMPSGQPNTGTRAQAGFAFIACPAEYRSSGVMTSVVTQDDAVYQKDLGPDTAKLAQKVTAGTPSSSWHAAE